MAVPASIARDFPELSGCSDPQWREFVRECRQRHEMRTLMAGLLVTGVPLLAAAYAIADLSRVLAWTVDRSAPSFWQVVAVAFACFLVPLIVRDLALLALVRAELVAGRRPRVGPSPSPAGRRSEGTGLFLSGFRAFPELRELNNHECRVLLQHAKDRFPHSYVASIWARVLAAVVVGVGWYAIGGACCAGGVDSCFAIGQSWYVAAPMLVVYVLGGVFAVWATVAMIRHAWFSSVLPQVLDRTRCPHCGYHLEGLHSSDPGFICPECGGRRLFEPLRLIGIVDEAP